MIRILKDSPTFILFCAVSVLAAFFVGYQLYHSTLHKSARQEACARAAAVDNEPTGPLVGPSTDQAICDGRLPATQQ